MRRSATISLGEFRMVTKDMSDDTIIMVASDRTFNQALAVQFYPQETSLDRHGVILLQPDTSDSVYFTDGMI